MIQFKIIIFLAIVLTCNGHLRLLGDILSSTHDKIHSTVHDVAGTVLGGLSHGINLNLEGHVGINEQRRPDPGFHNNPHQNGYNQGPQTVDKVIVIIKEEDNNRRPDNYQEPNRPPFDNGYRPNNQRPNYDNSYGQGNYNNGQSNYEKPNNQYQGNNYNQGQHERPNGNNYNQNNYDRPNIIPEHNNFGNQGTHYGSIHTPVPEEVTTKQPHYPPLKENTTQKPDTDEPFFVPLSPDEYTYGGQKINISEPKRETNKETQKQIEDGVGALDIRFKDD